MGVRNGRLEVMRYLTSDEELKLMGLECVNIQDQIKKCASRSMSSGFEMACINGHLEIVRYLAAGKKLGGAGVGG